MPQDLDWLVDRRIKIQKALLALHHCNSEKELRLLLIGVGFSLWRAVFLVGPDRTELDVKSAADEFLEILISDNAIGYPQDKKTRKWMAGYYNNNAAFRLNALTQINEISSLFSPSELGKFAQFAPDQQKTLGQLKEQDLWDRLYEGLELAMRKLS